PTISPATKIETMTNSSMPYMPAPTPPTMISPSCILISGIMPPSAVKESCMALTAPQEAGGGDDREQRGRGNAEADLLSFHIAAGEANRSEGVIAVRFRPVADGDAGNEQHGHDRKDGPALTLVADHTTEYVGERRADREDRDHLHEIRQRRQVLERMRGIGVEEAAAIGAEHLDRDLRRHRPDCDGLLGAFERRRLDVRSERLRNALPDQEQRVDDADRDEDVERAARDIDPEIADG